MVEAAAVVVAGIALVAAAFTASIAWLVRAGDASLVSGYTPGDLPPAEERVLTRRAGAVGYLAAAYTALGAPIALLSLPDIAWLAWTAGFLGLLVPAYAVDPRRWPPGRE
ncbi:hypothetical protein [Haloglomus halophilum]|uniref:hypothetical protein n=1 Tax=Haloglomus halophilum TaxID=2962672 RepID=UPI0020C942A3|nr:hypothetical protein [Haloglomus halophilum]